MEIRIRMDTPFTKKKQKRERGRRRGKRTFALQNTGAFAFMTQAESARSERMKSVFGYNSARTGRAEKKGLVVSSRSGIRDNL